MKKATPNLGLNQGPQAMLVVLSLPLFSPLSSSNVSAFFFLSEDFIFRIVPSTTEWEVGGIPSTLCPSTTSPTVSVLCRVVHLVQMMTQHGYITDSQSPFCFNKHRMMWIHHCGIRISPLPYKSCVPPIHLKNL